MQWRIQDRAFWANTPPFQLLSNYFINSWFNAYIGGGGGEVRGAKAPLLSDVINSVSKRLIYYLVEQSNTLIEQSQIKNNYKVTGHEKIGLMCTQNLTKFLDFKIK